MWHVAVWVPCPEDVTDGSDAGLDQTAESSIVLFFFPSTLPLQPAGCSGGFLSPLALEDVSDRMSVLLVRIMYDRTCRAFPLQSSIFAST